MDDNIFVNFMMYRFYYEINAKLIRDQTLFLTIMPTESAPGVFLVYSGESGMSLTI